MAVFFWCFVKSDLSSVRYCTRVHWTSHFLLVTRITWTCRPWLRTFSQKMLELHRLGEMFLKCETLFCVSAQIVLKRWAFREYDQGVARDILI